MDEGSLSRLVAAPGAAAGDGRAALAAATAYARTAAAGSCAVEQLIEAEGELGPFRTFCRQPAQRGRTRAQQLRRFLGTRSGRKIRYGQVLAGALDLGRVPDPLSGVLSCV